MPDDWSWFFSSEYGRDRMLREEVEGLQASAYESSAQSARLSSQLRTLQGSIEARLQALSTAFDAYVELGDVREQLAAHPDTSAVRRDVLAALAVLAQGGVPEQVDGRDVDYWLVDAANEVVRLASGDASLSDAPAGAGPGSTGQEHEMFVVAALGWLGKGERVADRVAPLLLGDGALAAPQVLLWRAAAHGLYGDVLGSVGVAWQADLDLTAPTWDRLAHEASGSTDPVATLRRVRDLLVGTWVPARAVDAGPPPDDRLALRSLLDALVGAGLGDERVLLERSRVLRARIEDPGAPEVVSQAEPSRTRTTVLVQQALLDPDVTTQGRRHLVAWARPGLDAAARGVADRVAAEPPPRTVARTGMGDAEVGTDGADPARLVQLDTLVAQRWATPRSRTLAPAVVGAVTLVAGLVLLVTRLQGLGVFLLVLAAAAGVLLVREVLRTRSRRSEAVQAQQLIRQRVDESRALAVSARSAQQATRAEVAGLAREISDSATPAEPSRR